jgi:hypothetical protein
VPPVLRAFADGTIFGDAYGASPPRVLALHGWRRDRSDFRAVLDGLDALAVDLPGFGASPAPPSAWGSAEYARALDRIGGIRDYYQRQLPDVAHTRAAAIDGSVRAIQEIYRGTYFPHMRVGPTTYPNWRSHDGCFRCHGVLQTTSPGGGSQPLPIDCTFCHSSQVPGTKAELPVWP